MNSSELTHLWAQNNNADKKPIHGEPKPQNVPADAQPTPPVPCDLKVGDTCSYRNDQGVEFHGLKITGFSKEVQSWGGFVYLLKDSWWFPVSDKSLTKTNTP